MPRPLARACAAALALAAALPGCTSLDAIPAGTVVTCNAAADCPSGRACSRGRCVDPAVIDTVPPALAGATGVEVRPERVRAGQPFTVGFTVTEPLEGAPAVTLAASADVAIPCTPGAANAWTCTYFPTGGELGGGDGVIPIGLVLRDLSGNESNLPSVARVTLDFAAPAPQVATVSYEPSPSNPLASVARATTGTRVQVVVSADELLSATPSPSLVGRCGAATLAFAPTVLPGLAANDAAFEATVGLEPDGAYTLAVTWADDLGNEGTAPLARTVEVRTSAPTLRVDQAALVFVRSPAGNAAAEAHGGHTIPAGPYFAVEPSDVFTTATTLPAGAFLLELSSPSGVTTVVPSSVIVQSAEGPGAARLGVLRPADGLFPRQALATQDSAWAWLVGVDDAGNRSAPVRLATAEWVGAPNPPAFGRGAAVVANRFADPMRDQHRALVSLPEAAVAGSDGESVVAMAAELWERQARPGSLPEGRIRHAMAYDSARGRVVMFGGLSVTGPLRDTWEWDGARWLFMSDGGPEARSGHAMAYDAARGRVVLFGGTTAKGFALGTGSALGDTWEWSGSGWTQVATTGPGPRSLHAMAYDAGRRTTVLYGGAGTDTWLWDGTSWTSVTTARNPGGRSSTGMAYDGAHGRVVLWGGNGSTSETWAFDGSSWTTIAVAGPPGTEWFTPVAYDAARDRVLVLGPYPGTWEWDGSAWTTVAGGVGGNGTAMAYDAARREVVAFGGYISSYIYSQDTWKWNGAGWTPAATAYPDGTFWHAMAYDAARRRVVMIGGLRSTSNQTWTWDGGWVLAATAGPPGSPVPGMAYDVARSRVVLRGGRFSTDPITWEWDGSHWTSIQSAGPATGSMAYDAARGHVALLDPAGVIWGWDGAGAWTSIASGGPSGGGDLSGLALASDADRRVIVARTPSATWEWDGSRWTSVAAAPPRIGPVAYDPERRRVVALGEGTTSWEWDGATWTSVSAAGVGPSLRFDTPMAFHEGRRQMLLFGGNNGSDWLDDTWTRSASPSRVPAIQVDFSASTFGVDPDRVSTLTVRAVAGGTFPQGGAAATGATLLGWSSDGPRHEPGTWVPLPPDRAPTASSFVWTSHGAAEARRYLLARDGWSFQVQPAGGAGLGMPATSVSLDYLELRVRYTAP